MKKVYIETYGCQMNVYDTEIVKTILKDNNYGFTDEPAEAQVILINTCSVREHAHQKVYQRINNLKQLKRKNKDLVLAVLGCMAQNMRDELLKKGSGVDIIAGPDSYRKLPDLLKQAQETGQKKSALLLSRSETYNGIFPTRGSGVNAWIAVMRGCDNFCTFCVVPYARGRERSRDPLNVIAEVKLLVDQGFKQVTLLGQNVNSYKYDKFDFSDLINMVSEVDGVKRVRFVSPHPKDFPEKLIEVVMDNPKVCKHIHLPLQSGNNRILDLMNRTYTKEKFLKLALRMRELIPDLTLTTDIIVGFPTETEREYQDTLEVMQLVEFDSAFMFKYSERRKTIASKKFTDDVSENDKSSRIIRLFDMQKKIDLKRNQQHLGETFEVLVEGRGKKPAQLLGRNDGNKIVVFPDNGAKTGDFVNVKINEVTSNTLIG